MAKGQRVFGFFDVPVDDGVDCSGPLITDQSFKDDADINVIMARAEATGELPNPIVHGNRVGEFLDISNAPESYQDAWNIVHDAEARFLELPAKVRSRFANDPFSLLSFLQDPANLEEARSLGLVSAPVVSEEPVVPEPKAKIGPEGPVAQ
ncbi:MAG: internal scaffolding protein [Microvirus sp.]|nr:MAG: internal scaffolding protein [Microvirus sp.]